MIENNTNMKKLLLGVVSFGTLTALSAQTSLGSGDFASVGDNVVISTDDAPPTNLDLGTPGTNKTWNFTSLNEVSNRTINFVDPSTLPSGANFPTANLAQIENGSVVYLNKSNAGIEAVGTTQSFNGMGFDAQFSPAYSIIQFPLEYGDAINGSYNFKEQFYLGIDTTVTLLGSNINVKIDSVRIKRSTNITGTVDAWGTVEFTNGEIDALRASITQVNVDSTWAKFGAPIVIPPFANFPAGWNLIDQSLAQQIALLDPQIGGMLGNATATTTVNYKEFYAKHVNYRLAQIEVDGSGSPVKADWIQESSINFGLNNQVAMPTLKLFPNPTSSVVTLSEAVPAGSSYRIINSVGAIVAANNIQSNTISLAHLATGNYTVVLVNAKNTILAVEKVVLVK